MKFPWPTGSIGTPSGEWRTDRIGPSVPDEGHSRRRWLFRLIAVVLLLVAGFAFGWAVGTAL
jgi:hypothetical protein